MTSIRRFLPSAQALAALLAMSCPLPAWPAPASVGIPGSYQHLSGCGGDWDPACTATWLAPIDARQDIWRGQWSIPAGDYQYKAALNGTWDVNYGQNAAQNGPNIDLHVPVTGAVRFYYDDATHWVTSNLDHLIATLPGDWQQEVGCPGDWDPSCLRTWLEDPDGDGVYAYSTSALRAGSYQVKVAIGESWDLNYGAGGVQNGDNIGFTVPSDGTEIAFQWDSSTHVLQIFVGGIHGNLSLAQAHWVTPDTIAWNVPPPAPDTTYALHADPTGALALGASCVSGGTAFALHYDPAGLPAEARARFPHLASYAALKLSPADAALAPDLLRGQLAVDALQGGKCRDATSLQIPGALDALYAYRGPLGVTFERGRPTLRVWAPTARSVALHLFADSGPGTAAAVLPMNLDPATGVWSVAGDPSWRWRYYLYEVEVFVRSEGKVVKNLVTDPYSLSLSTNSQRSQIVDLSDRHLLPPGWERAEKPPLAAPEDIVVYELHLRDFSAGDRTVPAAHRGTFLAFTHGESAGMRHLRRLAQAGLTHLHLLPAFDFATVDEDRSTWKATGDLSGLPAASTEQQAATSAIAGQDGFNWGYDPWHYTVPEGSYATDPDGARRILEFRSMVQAINRAGLRVVMDVVYNHTTASGQSPKSVLDRVVPGYYHRLDGDGNVTHSTCCENTASEHAMMEKLMVDSVRTWATAYKVDGFRFDLMGHHMKSNMLAVRAALDALTPHRDGVDGRKIYVYGEGWNFGEVANDARGVNATQLNMAGTGIGTFSDRLRDAVRGGGPFSPRRDQGLATGLFLEPNGTDQGSSGDTRARLLHDADLTRLGMAGNLASYPFTDAIGASVQGRQVDYNGQPAGYALRPDDNIAYISAHDNETWFDALDAKLPQGLSMADRVRSYNLGISAVLLSQGIPFFHAGDDILRSKSCDKNSYDSGDWFNRIDWGMQDNGWGSGLPPASSNQSDWPVLGPLLADPALKPAPADIRRAADHFEEMLRVRKSSVLFRLRSAADILSSVRQANTGPGQIPGVVALSIERSGHDHGEYRRAVVVLNGTASEQTLALGDLAGKGMRLHPALRHSSDPVVRTSSYDCASGTAKVPARTTAVFVGPRGPDLPWLGCRWFGDD
jgi:pullulanase-type alpha-1,6-glucosidase